MLEELYSIAAKLDALFVIYALHFDVFSEFLVLFS